MQIRKTTWYFTVMTKRIQWLFENILFPHNSQLQKILLQLLPSQPVTYPVWSWLILSYQSDQSSLLKKININLQRKRKPFSFLQKGGRRFFEKQNCSWGLLKNLNLYTKQSPYQIKNKTTCIYEGFCDKMRHIHFWRFSFYKLKQ